MNKKTSKILYVQIQQPYGGWKVLKKFKETEMNAAINCCLQLQKQYNFQRNTRVWNIDECKRVFPVINEPTPKNN